MEPGQIIMEKNTKGVSQVPILRPKLFIIYINDFPTTINAYKTYKFADDTYFINTYKAQEIF